MTADGSQGIRRLLVIHTITCVSEVSVFSSYHLAESSCVREERLPFGGEQNRGRKDWVGASVEGVIERRPLATQDGVGMRKEVAAVE